MDRAERREFPCSKIRDETPAERKPHRGLRRAADCLAISLSGFPGGPLLPRSTPRLNRIGRKLGISRTMARFISDTMDAVG